MSTETGTLPLIRTELYRPRITRDLVPRPRLLQHLEERRGRPLIRALRKLQPRTWSSSVFRAG